MDTTLLLAPLIFIIGSLMIGAVLKQWLPKLSIPYTVGLFLVGGLLGILAREEIFGQGNVFSAALATAGNINPDWILYLFLPILIFSAAYDLDLHIFRKTLLNATLLSVPGVIISMLLTGCMMMLIRHFVPGYEIWSWQSALMFGALISATDPVAVVALLKELGTSKRFSTLIDGESMLNDGTGIVLFMIFFAQLSPTTEVVAESPVAAFLVVVLGGTALGVLIASIYLWFIRHIQGDSLTQNSAMILGAYLTFLLAQDIFEVSGVIALVAFGLTIAYWGSAVLEPKVTRFMKEFWDLLSHIANTLIFIIVGIIIAVKVRFSWLDLGVLVAVYIGLNVIRSLMVAILYPIMTRIGYGLSKRESVILSWGGLRGALGLTLALIVSYTDSIPEPIRQQVLFLTAGVVALTLIFNATTIKWMLGKLQLIGSSNSKQLLNESVRSQLHEKSEQYYQSLHKQSSLEAADWQQIEKYLPPTVPTPDLTVQPKALLAGLRLKVLSMERQTYQSLYDEGAITFNSLRTLCGRVDLLLDKEGHDPLSARRNFFGFYLNTQWVSSLQDYPRLAGWIDSYLHGKIIGRYDLACGMIIAQRAAIKLIDEFAATELIDEEKMHLQTLRVEIETNISNAEHFIREIAVLYPRSYRQAVTQKGIRMLRNFEQHTLNGFVGQGIIDREDADEWIARLKDN